MQKQMKWLSVGALVGLVGAAFAAEGDAMKRLVDQEKILELGRQQIQETEEASGRRPEDLASKSVYTLQDFGYGLIYVKGRFEGPKYLQEQSAPIGCFRADQLTVMRFDEGNKDLGIPAGAFNASVLVQVSADEMISVDAVEPPFQPIRGNFTAAILQFQRFAPQGSCLKLEGFEGGARIRFNGKRVRPFHVVAVQEVL